VTTADAEPRKISRVDALHLTLMLALTFSTGVIDAVGYIGLDRVFTGNMTGNVVILGMALTGANNLPIVGPSIALIAFLAGAVVAGRVLRPIRTGWTGRATTLFGVVAGIILALSIVLFAVVETPVLPLALSVTAALGFAMGMQAGTARHIAVKDVTTVVVTSTLTALAADSWLAGGSGQPWKRRAGAVILIGLGAVTGGFLVQQQLGYGLALSGLIVLTVAVVGHRTRIRAS
jgi:uncharacterized membrane protein YoaK (UPF0700 family)